MLLNPLKQHHTLTLLLKVYIPHKPITLWDDFQPFHKFLHDVVAEGVDFDACEFVERGLLEVDDDEITLLADCLGDVGGWGDCEGAAHGEAQIGFVGVRECFGDLLFG
jgi:hypothetical protein